MLKNTEISEKCMFEDTVEGITTYRKDRKIQTEWVKAEL
jgi:hypothetical protein